MVERLSVSLPQPYEEIRAWAQAISDMHYTASLVLDTATSYLPGEAIEAVKLAWAKVTETFRNLIKNLLDVAPEDLQPPSTRFAELQEAELVGIVGAQKRSLLGQLRDEFLSYFWSEPHTDEKHRKASEAAGRHLDLGAVALDSLGMVSGFDKFCKVAQEGVLGVKYMLEVRRSRGH